MIENHEQFVPVLANMSLEADVIAGLFVVGAIATVGTMIWRSNHTARELRNRGFSNDQIATTFHLRNLLRNRNRRNDSTGETLRDLGRPRPRR